jgi:siroheme synthase
MAVTIRKRSQADYIVADCLVPDGVGDMVRISADSVGGVYQVTKLDINNSPIELPVGMMVRKLTTTRCVVQLVGEVPGVYTGLLPGKQLFIDQDSRLTHVVPTAPSMGVKSVHPAAQALSSTTLLLRVQSPTVRVP